jgi:hypothetical protein
MDAITLHDAIAEVCPVISTTVGDENDRTTWSFIPDEQATAQEIAAGENVIATIPIEIKSTVTAGDFIARWTNAEYLALEKKRRDDIAANKVGNAKNWDNVVSDSLIDMNKKKVQSLKTDLIADGVLTQARADEIFS